MVEALPMCSSPGHEGTKPERIALDFFLSVDGKGDKPHREVFGIGAEEMMHEGVDKKFSGAVGRVWGACDLLDEISVSLRNRRGDEKGDRLVFTTGQQANTIVEAAIEGAWFHQEM